MYSWLVFTSKLNKKLQKTFIGRQVLRVNSGATALEFASTSSDYVLLATTTASSTGTITFDGYFSSTYERYVIAYYDIYLSSSAHVIVRFNRGGSTITASNYKSVLLRAYTDLTPSSNASVDRSSWNGSYIQITSGDVPTTSATSPRIQGELMLFNPLNTATYKTIQSKTTFSRLGDLDTMHLHIGYGRLEDSTSALSGIIMSVTAGNFTDGTFKLYGIK